MSDVTRILQSITGGDAKAAGDLLPLVYEELRKLAATRMANESPNQTLQPTALVHEAWLRLTGNDPMMADQSFLGALPVNEGNIKDMFGAAKLKL